MTEQESGDGVLSNLPTTRPQRRSSKRDAPAKKSTASGGAARAGRPGPDKPAKAQGKKPGAGARAGRPQAAGRAKPAQGYEPQAAKQVTPPSNSDILVSAVRAAGELAQVGLTLGEHVARAAARRLKL